MKIFPWILVIALTVAAAWFYSEDQQKAAELAALKANRASHAAAAEAAVASDPTTGDENEVERLRKENEEVYRLRAEVAQLRKDALKNKAALTQIAQVSESAGLPPSPEPPPAAEVEDEATRIKNEHAMQCVNNMKAIEDAKMKWAEANGKNGGEAVSLNDITPYLPNQTLGACPDNGTYNVNEIGIPASCTVEGHSLLP